MEKRKCDRCGKLRENVHLTCVETLGKTEKLHLCEKCHDKLEKPFKKQEVFMNKQNITRIILELVIIVCCIIITMLSYNRGLILSGILWSIVCASWSVDLGYNVKNAKQVEQEEYIRFLEFVAYNYMCIMNNKQGELNAKQEQVDNSKKHKGE